MSSRRLIGERKAIRVRISGGKIYFETVKEKLVKEYSLKVIVNGIDIGEYVLSPGMIEEFVYGNLFTLGFINRVDDIASISYREHRIVVTLKQGSKLYEDNLSLSPTPYRVYRNHNVDRVSSNITISARQVVGAIRSFLNKSYVFKATGGVHSAALFEPKSSSIMFFAEDISRYNTVDKIIGRGFLEQVDFSNLVLIVSGRVFRSLLYKTVKAGIPIVISKAAPTCESVDYARETNTTLIGFARNSRFNVYSHPERVVELADRTTPSCKE